MGDSCGEDCHLGLDLPVLVLCLSQSSSLFSVGSWIANDSRTTHSIACSPFSGFFFNAASGMGSLVVLVQHEIKQKDEAAVRHEKRGTDRVDVASMYGTLKIPASGREAFSFLEIYPLPFPLLLSADMTCSI